MKYTIKNHIIHFQAENVEDKKHLVEQPLYNGRDYIMAQYLFIYLDIDDKYEEVLKALPKGQNEYLNFLNIIALSYIDMFKFDNLDAENYFKPFSYFMEHDDDLKERVAKITDFLVDENIIKKQ